MFGMNPTQLESQARLFLGFFGGFAAALGWTWFGPLTDAFLATIGPVAAAAGPVMYFGSAVWALIKNKQANILTTAKTLKDDKGVPVVEHITLAPTMAGRQLEEVTPPGVSTKPPAMTGMGR